MADFATLVRRLVMGTADAWWALLPQLMILQLLQWLVTELSFRFASLVIDISGWLALGVFGLSILIVLAMVVLQMRLVSNHVGGRRLIPADLKLVQARVHDDEFGRFLGLTILPFLCIYGAFGEIDQRMQRLSQESVAIQDVLAGATLTQQFSIDPLWPKGAVLLLVLLVLFAVRRSLEFANESTTFRGFGYLAAFAECMFMLLIIMILRELYSTTEMTFNGTRMAAWGDAVQEWIVSHMGPVVPFIEMLASGMTIIWPLVSVVLVLPALWFSLAGLVHGSKVVSLADLWQAGVSPKMAVRALVRRQAPVDAGGSRTVRHVVLTVQELLFGDLDDKYIPAAQAVRLAFRGGALFLAALSVLHTLLHLLGEEILPWLMVRLLGGHVYDFWFRFAPMLVDLPVGLVIEPVRITLLSVAFAECLRRVRNVSENVRNQEAPA